MNEERINKILELAAKRQGNMTVILENVMDYHNLGAVMRSCDAVGCFEIFVVFTVPSKQKNDLRLGKKTAAGSRKWLKVNYFTDLETCFEMVRSRYQKIWCTALESDAESIYDKDFTESFAILFGNEKDGVSKEAMALCDGNILIPQVGMAQSLNISVACAVTMYEAYRQRFIKGFYGENNPNDATTKQIILETYMERNKQKDRVRSVPVIKNNYDK